MALTKKQRSLIRRHHAGASPADVARRLGISPAAVRRELADLGLSRGSPWPARLAGARRLLDRPLVAFAVIAGIALLLRLIHLAEVHDTPFHQSLATDQALYDEWGRAIAAGDWAGRSKPVFYLGPLYPYVLGLIYLVAGPSPLAATVVQAILSGLTAGLVFLLGRRVLGHGAGLVSGLLAAAYGPFVFYSSLLLGATVILCLDLLMLVLLAAALRRPAWWRWLGAGLCLGLSAAARGTALLFVPFLLAALAVGGDGRRLRTRAGGAVLVALGALVAILPLTLHNRLIGGDWVPLTANAGINLYIGNHPETLGTYSGSARYRGRPLGLSVRDQVDAFPRVAAEELGRPDLLPSEVSRFWTRKTGELIAADTPAWLRTVGNKARYAFNAYEVPNNRNYDYSKRFSRLLRGPLAEFGLVAPLGLAGLVVLARRWRRQSLLYGFFLAQLAGLLLFFVTARYRLPLAAALVLFAGGFAAWAWDVWKERRARALLGGLALLLAFGLLVHAPAPESSFVGNHVNLAVGYRDRGEPRLALASLDDALDLDPGFYYASMLKGEILAGLGRDEEAATVLGRARALAVRNGDERIVQRIDRALAGGAGPAE